MSKLRSNRENIPPLKARRRELRSNPTRTELLLWRNLRSRQLLGKKFRRQYSIGRYVVDFFCTECDLAIELDGAPHYSILREEYETKRTHYLQESGIEILRFENKVVHQNLEGVLEIIPETVRKKCLR